MGGGGDLVNHAWPNFKRCLSITGHTEFWASGTRADHNCNFGFVSIFCHRHKTNYIKYINRNFKQSLYYSLVIVFLGKSDENFYQIYYKRFYLI